MSKVPQNHEKSLYTTINEGTEHKTFQKHSIGITQKEFTFELCILIIIRGQNEHESRIGGSIWFTIGICNQ